MKVSDFDFFLHESLIAERPLRKRDTSRLLVLHRDGSVEHRQFTDITLYLDNGDMLLINNTKVFPARLTGYKDNGGTLEILIVKEREQDVWEILSKGNFTGKLTFSDHFSAEIHDGRTAHFSYSGKLLENIRKYGKMPLPPYIKRMPDESDRETYQSIFAKNEGSIAAPTASLHFSDRTIDEIINKGVIIRQLTLHVGVGTFKPIRTYNVEEHCMESEYFEIEKGLIDEIENTKFSGHKIISVGTTTTRAIEGYINGRCSVTSLNGKLVGMTDLFIYPGYIFKTIDSLITNFHLPRSTPLMLASALCGREKLMNAYREAIERRYRFLSYGDAMLIL
jgi:S-adenosylmethionine:tRNA ribosyltransferase-isomerase